MGSNPTAVTIIRQAAVLRLGSTLERQRVFRTCRRARRRLARAVVLSFDGAALEQANEEFSLGSTTCVDPAPWALSCSPPTTRRARPGPLSAPHGTSCVPTYLRCPPNEPYGEAGDSTDRQKHALTQHLRRWRARAPARRQRAGQSPCATTASRLHARCALAPRGGQPGVAQTQKRKSFACLVVSVKRKSFFFFLFFPAGLAPRTCSPRQSALTSELGEPLLRNARWGCLRFSAQRTASASACARTPCCTPMESCLSVPSDDSDMPPSRRACTPVLSEEQVILWTQHVISLTAIPRRRHRISSDLRS